LEAKAEISYRSQAEATVNAFEAAKRALDCISSKHAFSLRSSPSGGAYSKCCTKIDPSVLADCKLYSPNPGGGGNNSPGFSPVAIDDTDTQVCDDYPVWFYLEADLEYDKTKELWAQYTSEAARIKKSSSTLPLVVGTEGEYATVRRLIATVTQEASGSSFGAAERATCGGINITQLVTSPQKIITSQQNKGKDLSNVPMIVDFDTPTSTGVPIEVYCLYKDPDWVEPRVCTVFLLTQALPKEYTPET
jgi:hypothetical protein